MIIPDNPLTQNILISIIVPVYNGREYLAETIDSVINQTHTAWELIIVDDGSTDNTKQIVLDFAKKDPRVKYYYQVNNGQGAARNYGIRHSEGKFIAFLDSDDIWVNNKLNIQLNIIQKNNVDLVFSEAEYFSDNGISTAPPLSQKGVLHGTFFLNDLFQRSAIANSSVLVKKEVLLNVGLLDESGDLRGTEDWDLWLRIAKSGYIFFGNESILIKYRIHKKGIHNQSVRMKIGKIKITEKFDQDKLIFPYIRKKQYRFLFRELINDLATENKQSQIHSYLLKYFDKDQYGLISNIQKLICPLLSLKLFLILSNKFLYRIGYRLESFSYIIYSYLKYK